MRTQTTQADANIHLRARPQDKALIDQAAELLGTNRSQFLLASALKEARNVLLDQTTIHANAAAFRRIMDWMDAEPTVSEAAGMSRIRNARLPWRRG